MLVPAKAGEGGNMCGIIGLYGDNNASEIIQLGLYAQQHRGQESWGIICRAKYSFFPQFFPHKVQGLVKKEAFLAPQVSFMGTSGIGHVRYSTQGSNILENAQPHFAHKKDSPEGEKIYLAANGDITNLEYLKNKLNDNGIKVQTTNDGEVIVKIIGFYYFEKGSDIILAIQEAMKEIQGAFSAVLLTQDALYAFKDLYGFRPLVMGRRNDGTVLFASETVALDLCKFPYVRALDPGEIVKVDGDEKNVTRIPFPENIKPIAQCIFELIYFSHPSSFVFGCMVSQYRKRLGEILAERSLELMPILKDNNHKVTPIPDSSNQSALGFAYYLKNPIPIDLALVRSHYTGRTFIAPEQALRDFDVLMKFAVNSFVCRGTVLFVIDDSIVRGTTLKKIVALLKEAGAIEIHIRITSPPIKFPCHMGIDTHRKSELIAAKNSVEEINQQLGSDSLIYNTVDNLKITATECGLNPDNFCYACFNGDYPCPIPDYE